MVENQKPTVDWLWLLFVVLLVLGWVVANFIDTTPAAAAIAWQSWIGLCAGACGLAALKYLISYRGGL